MQRLFLACHRLLIVHFDLEAQIFDHPPDFGGWRAWRREVVVPEGAFLSVSMSFLSIDFIVGSDIKQDDLFLGHSQRESDAVRMSHADGVQPF